MTNDALRRMLQRLAEDDDYRRTFEADPVGELARHGIKVDPAKVPKAGVKLPAKEEIARSADQLAAEIESTAGLIIFAR